MLENRLGRGRRGLFHRLSGAALTANRVSEQSRGPRWQRNEFRSNDFRTRTPPGPVKRENLLLKQQIRWQTSLLRPQILLEKGPEARGKRFDYSETRLSAHGLVKTTPKLISLPRRAVKLLPNSCVYHKQPRNRPHAVRQAKRPPGMTGTGGGSQQRVNQRSNAAGLIERAPYQRCCNGGMRRSDNRLRPQAALRLRAGVLGVG